MREDTWARLQQLGVTKGARALKPGPGMTTDRRPPTTDHQPLNEVAFDDEPQPIEVLLPGGRMQETAEGACFVLDHVYPLAYQHGRDRLADLPTMTPAAAAVYCREARLADLRFEDLLFLDTETTGLAGAGVFAFMVGVGFFERDAFVVRQYFCRDHGDEATMLAQVADLSQQRRALVTFNGRSFDMPLLNGRYLMNRLGHLGASLWQVPHLDLLPPSRRLWRGRFVSCALSSLEQQLLGVQRSHLEVPGWAIPGIYHDYLRSGDGREVARVFYHNEVDMLSMATLAGRIFRQLARPSADDHPLDLFSLGKWQLDLGLAAEAEQWLRLAAAGDLPLAQYHQVLHHLGGLLKHSGRREEAVPLWQQIAVTSFEDVAAHVELAKHYEWQHQDMAAAMEWTRRALALVERWPKARLRGEGAATRQELEHRLARLQRKKEIRD